MSEPARKIIRTWIGTVVSNKMQKTFLVSVPHVFKHPKLHGKTLMKSTKFMVHDEKNECNLGDIVEVKQSRPLSRHKRHMLHRIVRPMPQLADYPPANPDLLNRSPAVRNMPEITIPTL